MFALLNSCSVHAQRWSFVNRWPSSIGSNHRQFCQFPFAPEWIKFNLTVIVYRALHRTAPRYLSDQLSRVADMPSRSRLRSSTSNKLTLRPSCHVTVGERSCASAGPKLRNSVLSDNTSASSLTVFRRKLKTHLFRQSYPHIIMSRVCRCLCIYLF